MTLDRDHGSGLNAAVADVLRGELAAHGWTQAQLAEETGISVVTIQRLLARKRAIDVEYLEMICAALAIDPRDVFQRAEGRRPPEERGQKTG